jgi:hypothetical protein
MSRRSYQSEAHTDYQKHRQPSDGDFLVHLDSSFPIIFSKAVLIPL